MCRKPGIWRASIPGSLRHERSAHKRRHYRASSTRATHGRSSPSELGGARHVQPDEARLISAAVAAAEKSALVLEETLARGAAQARARRKIAFCHGAVSLGQRIIAANHSFDRSRSERAV